MTMIIGILAALAAASIPLLVGWEWGKEKRMAEVMGLSAPKRRFSLDVLARQSGTGMNGEQILIGLVLWAIGGFLLGLPHGFIVSTMFGLAGGLIYWGSLKDKKEDRRSNQAVQIARAMGIVDTVLSQGRPLQDALEQAAEAMPEEGREVLEDLVRRIRQAPADQIAKAVREWGMAWDNPAADMLAAALIAGVSNRVEIAPLIRTLQTNIMDVTDILHRSHAEANGIIWQARFLAFWPAIILAIVSLISPAWSIAYHKSPWLIFPALIGSGTSWGLSMYQIRKGLGVDAGVGMGERGEGEITVDRLGKVI